MASTFALIASTETTTTVGSITFSGIPATYNDLALYASTVGNAAGNVQDFQITLNGDTGSNYNAQEYTVTSSAVYGNKAVNTTRVNLVQPIANYPSFRMNSFVYFFNYVGSTRKHFIADETLSINSATSWQNRHTIGDRNNTAVTTSITLTPQSGSFTAGCIISLYGIKNS